MTDTEIELEWQGFFSFADFAQPTMRPEGLSGIYLLVRWVADKPSIYVGSASNIASRFESHLGHILALGYYTREDDGSWFPKSSKDMDFWLRIQDLDTELERSKKAVLTTQFAWALTDPDKANAAERATYLQLKEAEGNDRILFDNTTGIEKRKGQSDAPLIPLHTGARDVVALLSGELN